MDPSTTRTARRINSAIRNKIVDMYKQFVSEVDPTDVLDLLIEKRIIPLDRREEVLNHRTKPERCRALLDQLFICSHNEAFIVLRKAINERYPWLVERIDASETEEEDGPTGPTRTTAEVFITTLEVKLKAAEKRIAELEEEVARYKNQNDQLKQLLQRSHEDKLGASLDDVDTAYGPLPDVTGHYIKPTKQGEEVSSDKPTNGCPSLPSSRPCRSKSPMEAKAPAKDNGADATPLPGCLSFLNTITGSAAVRGMAMMDSTLFVVRFGSLLVEMYDGKDKFKRSRKNILISPPDHKDNTGFPRKINIVKRGDKVRASSGIQDIACCHLNKRLYVSDWQGRCVHCVNPAKREIVRCWAVEAGRPWGLSVTREGTVVVSLGESGELCEYTGEGILLRTVALKTVEEGPWHGVQFGKDAWMFCHGERYGTGGYVSVADLEGNHFGGCRYREIHMQGPSHLALLPDNRVLVAESERNRVVVLDQSLSGPGQEILNPDHGVAMPVRLHYCRSSEKLFVGLHNGSILVYQMKNAVTAPSTSISQC